MASKAKKSKDFMLGYDARTISSASKMLWDDSRRSDYLLKHDVDLPLSVDRVVWPSIFDWGIGVGFSPSERRRLLFAGVTLGSDVGVGARPLFSDVGQLATSLSTPIDSVYVPFWKIGVALGEAEISDAHEDVSFLGYDVADESFISGLANCGREAGVTEEKVAMAI